MLIGLIGTLYIKDDLSDGETIFMIMVNALFHTLIADILLSAIAWANMTGGIFDLYEIVPGFIFAGIAMIVMSLLSPEPSEDIQREFDAVVEETRS